MSTLVDRARSAVYKNGQVVVVMHSGMEIRFPVVGNLRLSQALPEQLSNIEISPYGLHWPDLDEDLSFRGILQGNFGQRKRPAHEDQ